MDTNAETGAPEGFDLSAAPVKETVDKSEGAWMHLRHPSKNHQLYVGPGVNSDGSIGTSTEAKAVRVKVLYARSRQVIEHQRRLDREATLNAGSKMPTIEQSEEMGLAVLRFVIVGFENLYFKGRALDAKHDDDKTVFMNMADEYVTQVSTFSTELSHFFGSGSSGSQPSEPGSDG